MQRIAVICLLFAMASCAVPQHVREEDKTFSQVFEAPGLTKQVLYEKVKIWLAQNFKSAKAVIEYDNKDEGTIIGNGSIKYPCSGMDCIAKADWTVPFTMRVDTKDYKYRLTFSNLRLTWPAKRDSVGYLAAGDVEMWQQSDFDAVRPILLRFGDSINNNILSEKKSSDW